MFRNLNKNKKRFLLEMGLWAWLFIYLSDRSLLFPPQFTVFGSFREMWVLRNEAEAPKSLKAWKFFATKVWRNPGISVKI